MTSSFEKHKVPSSRLDEYEKRVMKGESLLQILEVIYDMFLELMKHLDRRPSPQMPASTVNHFQTIEKELEDSQSPEERYSNLEKLLQKYEAQIRDHIRVEQQLKIYVESLQESFAEKENILNEAVTLAKEKLTVHLNYKRRQKKE